MKNFIELYYIFLALSRKADVSKITYDDLCNFLYMREKVQDKISQLCDIVQQFDTEKQVPNLSTLFANVLESVAQKHTKLQGSLLSSTDKLVGCHFPQCFVCKREFVQCMHICANCRVCLGDDPCPACNKGLHVLTNQNLQSVYIVILN